MNIDEILNKASTGACDPCTSEKEHTTREEVKEIIGDKKLKSFENISDKLNQAVILAVMESEEPMLVIIALGACLDSLIKSFEQVSEKEPGKLRATIALTLMKGVSNETD